MKQKRVLTIQDLSCFGKCSLSMSVAILSALGHEAVVLPTILLSTHTSEFENYTFLDLTEETRKITSHFKELNLEFDAILIGYLGKKELIDRASEIITEFGKDATIIVDPAMAENGELYAGFDNEYVEKMKKLCSLAHFITPNTTEAKLLGDIKDCKIIETGIEKDGMVGIKCDGKTWMRPLVPGQFYGTGDAFSSTFTGTYLKGKPIDEAIELSLDFVWNSISMTKDEHKKYWYGTKFEQNLKFLTDIE